MIWINIRDEPYGAKGDGSVDDYEAVQAAIDAASIGDPEDRNALYAPAGNYRIT